MTDPTIRQAKQAAREQVWRALATAGVVAGDVDGKIPAFDGADEGADRLAALSAWSNAKVIKAVPVRDSGQQRVGRIQRQLGQPDGVGSGDAFDREMRPTWSGAVEPHTEIVL